MSRQMLHSVNNFADVWYDVVSHMPGLLPLTINLTLTGTGHFALTGTGQDLK